MFKFLLSVATVNILVHLEMKKRKEYKREKKIQFLKRKKHIENTSSKKNILHNRKKLSKLVKPFLYTLFW